MQSFYFNWLQNMFELSHVHRWLLAHEIQFVLRPFMIQKGSRILEKVLLIVSSSSIWGNFTGICEWIWGFHAWPCFQSYFYHNSISLFNAIALMIPVLLSYQLSDCRLARARLWILTIFAWQIIPWQLMIRASNKLSREMTEWAILWNSRVL